MGNTAWAAVRLALLVVIASFCIGAADGECKFPDFVQSERIAGEVTPWITMRKYDPQNMYNFEEETLVNVTGGRIEFLRHRISDETKERMFERECFRREPDNAYIVKHTDAGDKPMYACMKFISRGKNAVQVLSSQPGDQLESTLCDRLEKVEWPWLAVRKREWVFCPVVGGYKFQIQDPTRNGAKICASWKQFRMESECMQGEGIQLTYPDDCSPFGTDKSRAPEPPTPGTDRGETFTCFAGWREDDYIFMILLAPGQSVPQYTMRLPVSMTGDFIGHLYFSAVTPYEVRGVPPSGNKIHYLELKMSMAESDACTDESPDCVTFVEQNLCDRFHKDCKKSCKMCNPEEDISAPNCTLPRKYRKKWTLYDPLYTEDVTVTESRVRFDSRDPMVCRAKHSEKDMFKLVTKYENGCRPRYTCADFQEVNSNVLRYRISPSSQRDQDLTDLCHFIDDDYPLKDSIRSERYKHLVVKSQPIKPVPCGIDANIAFTTTPGQVQLNPGDSCSGNLSDWNTQTCTVDDKLTVYPGTCSGKIRRAEYECLAVIDETSEYARLLLTRRKKKPTFNCWIITAYDEADSWVEGRLVHKMPTTQCNAETRLSVFRDHPSEATFYLYDDNKNRVCSPTSLPYVVITDEEGNEIWRSAADTIHFRHVVCFLVTSVVMWLTR